jgi:hypothetical protein
MPNITRPQQQIESLGARIVRLASQAKLAAPSKPRVSKRGEHEYVRDRARALALIRDRAEARAELARKLGQAAGWVIGFRVFHAEQAPLPRVGVRIGGGGEWTETARATDRVERPTKRRGRPGRRGKLVAALARSRTG